MNNRIKKSGLMLILVSLTTSAHAVSTGWYVGGQLGQSNTHNQEKTVYTISGTPPTIQASPTNTGLGGRVFTGYQFNQFAAFEMGYTHYAATTYSVPESSGLCKDPAIRTNSIDLEGKGLVPFANSGVSVYGKAGVAFVRVSMSGSFSPDTTSSSVTPSCDSNGGTTTSVRPLIGLGLSYDISQNWVTDLSLTRVFGGGSVKSADLVALGISYHWVDKYCGQFLC